MKKFTLAQQQLRVVNAIAGHFGHLFSMSDNSLREIFSIADLLTVHERRGAELSESQGRSIYERLIECRTIAKKAEGEGVALAAWKAEKSIENPHIEYEWKTETGRYRVEVRFSVVTLEVWHTDGGKTLEGTYACGGWLRIADGLSQVSNVTLGCEPRHVQYLMELAESLRGVVDDEALDFFYSRLMERACNHIGQAEMVSALTARREFEREVKDYDRMWLWTQALGWCPGGGERS